MKPRSNEYNFWVISYRGKTTFEGVFMALKDVFFYSLTMLGTFIIGLSISLAFLLMFYIIVMAALNLNLLTQDSLFYKAILFFIGIIKNVIGQVAGWFY